MLAALSQLWSDLPDDPRDELAEKVRTARERQRAAEANVQGAVGKLDHLGRQRRDRQRDRDAAQQVVDDAAETRRLLVAVIAAAIVLADARKQLPTLRDAVSDTSRRVEDLQHRKPHVAAAVVAAKEQVRIHARGRDDAAELLRAAGLSATTDGPVPADDEAMIRARLGSIEEALADKAVDPELHKQVRQTRQHLSDLNARLNADTESRLLAEQFAASDGARHPVALQESVRAATEQEAHAREQYARAQATAEIAAKEYQRRAEDSSDKSSPDVDGFPPAGQVTSADDADRHAEQLDDLSAQQLITQRTEEHRANEAAQTARDAEQSVKLLDASVKLLDASVKLLDASVKPLRHLADATLTGRRATDIGELVDRIGEIAERVRKASKAFLESEQSQQTAADSVRDHANSREARKVEADDDPRVVDLILRLRADPDLPAEAERIAGHLEQRAASLRDDLDSHDRHVRTSATMLHVQAATALERLRAYHNQSRLPDGLGDWSQRRFVTIDHEPVPDDESVAIDRVARVVHALLGRVPAAQTHNRCCSPQRERSWTHHSGCACSNPTLICRLLTDALGSQDSHE
jgi:hypothetical protein